MEWTDTGIVLSAKAHGENHAVVTVFTPSAGKVSALVHGGQGKTQNPKIQPGNEVQVTWKGRSENALGHFSVELTRPWAAELIHDRKALAALLSMTGLLVECLPEKQSVPDLYSGTYALLSLFEDAEIWPIIMVKWEVGLLSSLGFGLDLSRCAATGQSLEDGADLVFVSPKSGCAVSLEAGLPYKDRMLVLPPFLIDRGDITYPDLATAYKLTGFFLEDRILHPAGKTLPASRQRMINLVLPK